MPIPSPIPIETLLEVVRSLPAAPRIFARVGKLLLNPNSDSAEVVRLLRMDAALTARIIKISNSVFYHPDRPTSTVEEAILRIGYDALYRLTGLAAAAEFTAHDLPTYGITGAQLRENSLLCALIAEELAPYAGCDPQHAYTAALLRSIGRVALDRLARSLVSRQAREGGPKRIVEWEVSNIGLCNTDAAAFILTEWRFPATTIASIRDHYLLASSDTKLAYVLNLAAGAADRCQHSLPGESAYWEPLEERCQAAGVTEEQLNTAMREALIKFGPVRASID
jgi:HD-like signal output (HDOD) protein